MTDVKDVKCVATRKEMYAEIVGIWLGNGPLTDMHIM